MIRYSLFLGLYFFCCGAALADYPLEIIELKARPVDEIIPLVRPFAGPDGTVSGMNNQLIIRASPERLKDIHEILERFDRPPRSLIIQVRHGRMAEGEKQRLSAGINANLGEHAQVEIGDATPPESVRIRAGSRSTRSMDEATHRIRATEGKPAFIATGQSIPIREQSTYISGHSIHQQTTTRYRDVTGGFYVVPQLNGDQVTLRISPHMDRPGQVRGTFDIQHADTTIVGYLGEWIPIGGVEQGATQERAGTLRRYSTSSREDRQIYLLVEEAP
jgi:type II secretory pathway component GspD/PulD (secretin)